MRRLLLMADTAPATFALWFLALCWCLTIALLPERSYTAIHLGILPHDKTYWLWPAVLAAALPLVGPPGRYFAWRLLARCYGLAWWLSMTVALLLLAPSFVWFWGPGLLATPAAFWLVGREIVDHQAPNATG